jgi:hypothetical protein
MRGVRLWGVTAALIVGLGGAVAAADGPDIDVKAAAPKGLLSGLFSNKSKPPAKSAAKGKSAEEPPAPLPSVDNLSAERQHYINAFLRRMAVCDRLREVAQQTGNDALEEQANQLEDRATEIFRRQTNGLPAPAPTVLRKPREANEPYHVMKTMAEDKLAPPPSLRDTRSLDGNMDQREQAILNGSSMGGMKP